MINIENKKFTGLTMYNDGGLIDWLKKTKDMYYFKLIYKDNKKSRLTEIKDIEENAFYIKFNERYDSPLLILKNNKGVYLDNIEKVEVYFKVS